jgi:ubiquinone/menaquinone biosynthesis C-methylase UbiE
MRYSVVADVGAGTGYFSARIAKRVPEGKVFAIGIEQDMLRYLQNRAAARTSKRARARAGEYRNP